MGDAVTGQVADQVQWRNKSHDVTAVDGSGLFEAVGVRALSTACYRGYIASYEIHGHRLVLVALDVDPEYEGAYLGGSWAMSEDGLREFRGLDVSVPFSGRLLIGAGYVDIGRLHMGFRPAFGYRRVWELVFNAGRLVAAHDRSAALADVRRAGIRPGPADGEPTGDWIERTFSLSFAYSWPGFDGTDGPSAGDRGAGRPTGG